MHRLLRLLPAIFALTCTRPAPADTIDYHFAITNLKSYTGASAGADFTLDILTNGYITTTGLTALPAGLPTTVGITVFDFGENTSALFEFNQYGGLLTDGGATLSSASFILAISGLTNYIEAPGTFNGLITGDNPFGFTGNGTLTVTDTTLVPTPEPSSATLLLLPALAGAACALCRRPRPHSSQFESHAT